MDALDMLPAEVAPPTLPRRRQLVTTTALASGAAASLIVALVGHYLRHRSAAGSDFLSGVTIPLTQPNVQLFTLLLASVAIQWAVWAIAHDERSQSMIAMGLTGLFGLAYLNQSWFLLDQLKMPGTHPDAPVLYALVGSHLFMTMVALVMLLLVFFRVVGGNVNSRQPDGLSATALYWHVTVGCYALIWYAVYITK